MLDNIESIIEDLKLGKMVVLVDDEDRGLVCGVVEKLEGTRIHAHFVHHKCAKKTGHWKQVIESAEVLLIDTTYQQMYENGSVFDE